MEVPELADDLPRESLVAAIDRDLRAGAALGTQDCPAETLAGELRALRDVLTSNPADDLAAYLHTRFTFRRSTGRPDGALVTGYFEPVVEGRMRRDATFRFALYRRPPDLIEARLGDFAPKWAGTSIFGRVVDGKLAPYYSRAEIDGERVLDGRRLELAWLADPVDRFFLHVQGSGVIRYANGSTMRVGYAGSNGRPYTSIGKLLTASGALGGEPATSPAIQAYLRAHPQERDGVLAQNERYVFFRETPDGPVGKLGVTLTAGRSIAVDPSLYPLGGLAYLETSVPVPGEDGKPAGRRAVRRLVLPQDAGAAITGPGRVDLFVGSGDAAGREAGLMSERGALYLLVPKTCR